MKNPRLVAQMFWRAIMTRWPATMTEHVCNLMNAVFATALALPWGIAIAKGISWMRSGCVGANVKRIWTRMASVIRKTLASVSSMFVGFAMVQVRFTSAVVQTSLRVIAIAKESIGCHWCVRR